jgi:hypothetical protein
VTIGDPIQLSVERAGNGGFPEPLAGEPVRAVRCRHDACGADTRVRLPGVLSADAVRRVVCDSCQRAFTCQGVVDEGAVEPAPLPSGAPTSPAPAPSPVGVPGWLSDPESRAWRYLSIPIAAAVVIGALALIQGC